MARFRPGRDLPPFLLGVACTLLFTSLRLSVSKVEDLNGVDRASNAVQWSEKGGKTAIAAASPPPARTRVQVVIGVQTGFTGDRSNPKYDYTLRRQALRQTWFPPDQEAVDKLECRQGIVMRFVIGHSADPKAEAEIAAEEKKYGGFLRLPLQEGYLSLANKTLTFFRTVTALYDADYIIKADDDVYLRVDRVPPVIAQWSEMHADYIGCMKTGPIYTSPEYRWYEPQHAVLGSASYFTHCWGTVYVLSGRAAAAISALDPGLLRFFANEDVTVGSWMLALKMQHYDDRRLCATECSESSVAVYDMPTCAGLCDPPARLKELHAAEVCQAPAVQDDGTVPLVQPAFDFFTNRR